MIEEMQNDGIAEVIEYQPRSRMIMLTIPLCNAYRSLTGETLTDSEGWPIYQDLGDSYRQNVVDYIHVMCQAMQANNYAIGEEFGDDMTVSKEECYREDGTLKVYRHMHAVIVKANNNPLTKKLQKELAERLHADLRTIKNPKAYSDVLNYVTKDVRYGLYRENTIERVPSEVTKLITEYEEKGIPKWAQTLLSQPSSNRTIHVVLDKVGGTGKSYFSKYMWAKKRAFYINDCADTRSIERAIVDHCRALDKAKEPRPKIVIADLPRAKDIGDPIYWEAMERAINGLLTEDRYNTESMIVNIDKAILFCNNLPWDGRYNKATDTYEIWPTLGMLESHDRFVVWEIVNNELQGPYRYYKSDPRDGAKGEEYEVLVGEIFDRGDTIEKPYRTQGGAGLYWRKQPELRQSV